MYLSIDFNTLTNTLSNLASVVEDSMSSDEMKTILFQVSEEKLVFLGMNRIVTLRKTIDQSQFDVKFDDEDPVSLDSNGCFLFQLVSKDLMGLLNTFKASRRMKPELLEFRTAKKGTEINLTITEVDTEDAERKLTSSRRFDCPTPNMKLQKALSSQAETSDGSWEEVDPMSLLYYVSNMMPVMSNDNSNLLYNSLSFAEDYIIGFSPKFTTLIKNQLPKALSGFSMSYPALSFVKSVICSAEYVQVTSYKNIVAFRTPNAEAFVTVNPSVPRYNHFIENAQDASGVEIDRLYFIDVLKRLALQGDNVTYSIEEDCQNIRVSNQKYSQLIPILRCKNMEEVGEVTFKTLPSLFMQAIIGDDAQFPGETFLYIAKSQNSGYNMTIADSSKTWFSVTTLR